MKKQLKSTPKISIKKKGSLLVRQALLVATMDDAGTRLSDADIYIEDGVIRQVGKRLAVKADRVLDARGCVVLPGLVNTHHHLYQTFTRNLPAVQNAKLFDWLIYLYEIWRRLTPEMVHVSALVGLGELALTGCTTSTDHFYVFPKGQPTDLIDEEIAAARKLGVRFHPCRGSMSRGRSKGGLPPDDVVQSEDAIMKDCDRLVRAYHDPARFSMTRIALAPCSPFSVTTELLKETADYVRRHNLRAHTHLAETIDEEKFCMETQGVRPLGYMEKVGWMGNAFWFAHAVHLNDKEISAMGRTRTGVAHCPTSNLRLGSGIAPLRKMLDKGVPVGLGVDGSASNDSSDILGEARQALLVHRVTSGVGSTTAEEIFRVATRGGAEVLGRDDIGSIEPGKAGDLAIFDLRGLDYAGAVCHDPLAALIFAGISHRTRWTV
ncbi:MAG TPA: 8-oxoguanine deaminase, partial [Elusimicrobiota bacterium]|nr:8-oxoguanine deaminase [Elusimicrobiota bacterium]